MNQVEFLGLAGKVFVENLLKKSTDTRMEMNKFSPGGARGVGTRLRTYIVLVIHTVTTTYGCSYIDSSSTLWNVM